MARTTHVVVVGGGYAGVVAANRLSTAPDLQVTLVNPRSTFVQRIRLHQRTAGTHDAVTDFADVLAPTVRLTVDAVRRIDAPSRTLVLDSGAAARYDYLVYAVGSHSAPSPVPGANEHAHPLSTLEQAQALERTLAGTSPAEPLVVVGGGATGIETASELAETGRPVTLVTRGEVGTYLHPNARREVRRQLDRLGVTLLEGVTVAAVASRSVHLSDGRELPSAVTVWTAGFGVPDLAARSGLSTDAVGRVLTDETLTSIDDDRIVAAGDSAAPSSLPYRMSCAAALPLGAHAAATVLRRVAGKEPTPFSVPMPGQCLSLGRRAGIMQLSRRDDTATPVYVGGRLGAWLKESVTAGNLASLGMLAQHPGLIPSLTTVHDPRRARRVADLRDAAAAAPVRAH